MYDPVFFLGKYAALGYKIFIPQRVLGVSMKTLRQRAKDDPTMPVNRKEANEILDFEWELGLFPEQVRALWKELEDEYGLKPLPDHGGIVRRYRLNEVKEALELRERGDRQMDELLAVDKDELWPPPIVEWEEGDDDIVTAPEACRRLGVRRSGPTAFVQRLGIEPAGRLRGQNNYLGFRYGDVRKAHERRFREQFEP